MMKPPSGRDRTTGSGGGARGKGGGGRIGDAMMERSARASRVQMASARLAFVHYSGRTLDLGRRTLPVRRNESGQVSLRPLELFLVRLRDDRPQLFLRNHPERRSRSEPPDERRDARLHWFACSTRDASPSARPASIGGCGSRTCSSSRVTLVGRKPRRLTPPDRARL